MHRTEPPEVVDVESPGELPPTAQAAAVRQYVRWESSPAGRAALAAARRATPPLFPGVIPVDMEQRKLF